MKKLILIAAALLVSPFASAATQLECKVKVGTRPVEVVQFSGWWLIERDLGDQRSFRIELQAANPRQHDLIRFSIQKGNLVEQFSESTADGSFSSATFVSPGVRAECEPLVSQKAE